MALKKLPYADALKMFSANITNRLIFEIIKFEKHCVFECFGCLENNTAKSLSAAA